MPQAPNVDGLPLWLQITISLLFGFATLAMLARGYNSPERPGAPPIPPSEVAPISLVDFDELTEEARKVRGEMVVLGRALGEQVYFTREQIKLLGELCQRLRELRDRLDGGAGRVD